MVAVLLTTGFPALSLAQDDDVETVRVVQSAVGTGRHCLNSGGAKWVVRQLAAAQWQPAGAENSFRVGLCLPFITEPHALFDHTSVEFGVTNYLSPAYALYGGYVQITPISILQFGAEYNAVVYFPFVTDRAGYFRLDGYDSDFRLLALPSDNAETAQGSNLNLTVALRARVPLSESVGVVLLSMLSFEYWDIGDQAFYLNLRRELPVAQSDWFLSNELIVAAELIVTEHFRLRVGAYDAVRYVFESSYLANQAGLLVMGYWPTPGGVVRELSPFLRAGIYTHHAFRVGQVSLLGGVLVNYELGPL